MARNCARRKNLGGESGVVVGVCARKLVWFDPGELPRVWRSRECGAFARFTTAPHWVWAGAMGWQTLRHAILTRRYVRGPRAPMFSN